MKLTIADLARIMGAQNSVPSGSAGAPEVAGYSIDSRTIRPGELFFAIQGPSFDGHDFVGAALRAGAGGAVIEKAVPAVEAPGAAGALLRVPSTAAALEALACEVRRRWGKPLVAVTGSAGKTSTKEMIAAVLATRCHALKSEGNFNNQYGLPLSLLRLEDRHEAGVFELGMSRAGEIAQLARIAQPTAGVVTCVAPVHLEFFAGIEGIAAAKRELIEALPPTGAAVLNADDPLVARFAEGFAGRVVTFGIEQPAAFRAAGLEHDGLRGLRFRLEWAGAPVKVMLPLIGRHSALNALAAIAAGSLFDIAPAQAALALAAFRPAALGLLKMRGEVTEIRGATVINDCYNSNPRALQFMLEALGRTPVGGRRIAVLGEMRELGPSSAELHREAGRRAAEAADHVVAVSGNARCFLEGAAEAGLSAAHLAFFESPAEAGEYVASVVQPGDVVLFKGSRGVKLETALEGMRNADCGLRIDEPERLRNAD